MSEKRFDYLQEDFVMNDELHMYDGNIVFWRMKWVMNISSHANDELQSLILRLFLMRSTILWTWI